MSQEENKEEFIHHDDAMEDMHFFYSSEITMRSPFTYSFSLYPMFYQPSIVSQVSEFKCVGDGSMTKAKK